MSETMLLRLRVRRVGASRRVPAADVAEIAGREISPVVFGATKKIFACAEYDEIVRIGDDARSFVRLNAAPASFIGNGFYLMKVARYPVVDGRLQEMRTALTAAVDAFAAVYPARSRASMEELQRNGIPFREEEYPTLDEIRDGFSMSWQPLEFAVPGTLRAVDAQAWQDARAAAERQWQDALASAEALLVEELRGLLDHMIERLSPDERGREKILRSSVVDNLREFILTAPFRNVSSNKDLEDVCGMIAAVLGGASPQQLRDRPSLRETVRRNLEVIRGVIDTAVAPKPRRRILTDSDTEAA